MYDFDEPVEETNVPETFQAVQQSLDGFVRVNYETAHGMAISMGITPADITHYRGKKMDIIRNNPPLESIPKYLHDGREDYIWYSDFYDEVSKEVYHKYRTFSKPETEITSGNYVEELDKIDLPYFRELVDLVSLERLLMKYEDKVTEPKPENKEELSEPDKEEDKEKNTKIETEPAPKAKAKPKQIKRSYEPKLNNKQYALLIECIERIKLFRSPLKVTELKRLLKGKLAEPLQVTNQKSLVYLLEQLKENNYIKETWISVANGNKDFISFRTEGNKQRYGDEVHYIPMQQFQNNLGKSRKEGVCGFIQIEEMIEELEKYQDN